MNQFKIINIKYAIKNVYNDYCILIAIIVEIS